MGYVTLAFLKVRYLSCQRLYSLCIFNDEAFKHIFAAREVSDLLFRGHWNAQISNANTVPLRRVKHAHDAFYIIDDAFLLFLERYLNKFLSLAACYPLVRYKYDTLALTIFRPVKIVLEFFLNIFKGLTCGWEIHSAYP